MYELRSLYWSKFRLSCVIALSLALALAPAAAAQPFGSPSIPDLGTDPGVTDTDGEDEEIDEWENDILKSVASPSPVDHLRRAFESLLEAMGWSRIGSVSHP